MPSPLVLRSFPTVVPAVVGQPAHRQRCYQTALSSPSSFSTFSIIKEPKPRSSHMWKGVLHGADLLRRGVRISIGNGQSTFFWHHLWVHETPLIEVAVAPVPVDLLFLKVSDFWDGDTWNWAILSGLIPALISQKLMAIHVENSVDAEDKYYWQPTPSGEFSSKSAMQLIREAEQSSVSVDFDWKLIWRIPAQQRVRNFVYLAVHDCLLHNANRLRRHLASSASCPRCSEAETSLHMLRDCQKIKDIWLAIYGSASNSVFFSCSNISDWIAQNVTKEDKNCTKFANMLWYTWKCRNDLVFDGCDNLATLAPTVCSISEHYWSSKAQLVANVNTSQLNVVSAPLIWCPPSQGFIKLNVDASSKGNPGLAGGGGLFRNSNGDYLHGFAFKCGWSSALRAELWAVFHGFKLVQELGYSEVLVETDSAVATSLLDDPDLHTHPDYFLIMNCRRLLREAGGRLVISHILRSANTAADFLANYSFSMSNNFTLLPQPPTGLVDLLHLDSVASKRQD